ncbi:AI-2E family transporter [Thermonema rossianum]|jgi:predicted PurR-regulated permease PerM|uniref:AI-2E family transporter n=1 Tax=Thermonema rossianum TaxID=55505 RepID=UPI00056FE518|nr:AI-2E family transporter [Thermonema rossianum]
MPQRNHLQKAASGLIVLLASGYLLHIAASFFIDLATSFLLALLLNPLVGWLQKKTRMPAMLAIFLALLLVGGILLSLLFVIALQLKDFSTNWQEVSARFTSWIAHLRDYIEARWGIGQAEQERYLQVLVNNPEKNLSILNRLASSGGQFFGGLLASLSLIPIYTFFMLYYKERLRRFLFTVTAPAFRGNLKRVLRKLQHVIFRYILGMLLVFLVVAALDTGVLLAFSMENALLLGVLAGLLNFIPYIGTALGGLIPMIIALITKDSLWYPLGIGLCFWGVQLLENNVITPLVVGDQVSLNAFTIILVLVIGGMLWGAAGMVLAIPYAAIVKCILEEIPSGRPVALLIGDEPLSAFDK